MSYTFRPIEDRSVWEAFIATRTEANFLHSFAWGEFHSRLGKTVVYLGAYQNDQLVAVALGVKEEAKRGTYLSMAGGPILDWHNTSLVTEFLSAMKTHADQLGCVFVRFRPQVTDSPQLRQLLIAQGAKVSPMHLTADRTIELDLGLTDDQLLAGMRKSTRYSIKKAISLGITTSVSQNPQDLTNFYNHQLYLAGKHGFVPFSLQFLQTQFATFLNYDQVCLIHSFYQGQLLASAFVIFYNHEAAYHYGISTTTNAQLPGSYATQWAAIAEAKKRGCTRYNMWGVAPEGESHHRFAGVSLFKRGFGGQEVVYLPAHDLMIKPSYYLTFAFEKLRAVSRRL